MIYRVFGESHSPCRVLVSYGVYDAELAKLLAPLVMNVYDLGSVEGHLCIDDGVVSITRLLGSVDPWGSYKINKWAEFGKQTEQ